jgi:Flp pilus assembly protein TadD
MRNLKTIPLALIVGSCIAGCSIRESDGLSQNNIAAEAQDTAATFGSGPEQVWVNKAKENFKRGEYGLAERYFRQAIEERHGNAEAWLGLAASYDHLKRFEEADRAYEVLTKMAGNTPTILNNLGFHYMLKGDFAKAERTLIAAQTEDPDNPFIRSNLALLADWKEAAGKPRPQNSLSGG